MTTKLLPEELGCSDWFVTPDQSIQKWVVARSYDTLDKDSETGDPCYGAAYDVDSEHDTQEQAELRLSAIKGTMAKSGYTLVA